MIAWVNSAHRPDRRASCASSPATSRATRSARGSRRCCPTRSTGPTTTWWCRPGRCTAARRAPRPRAAAARASCSTGRQGLALQLLQQRAAPCARSRAALLDDTPADFAAIGPLSWAGEDASGTRAALAVARSRGPAQAAADRPAVFVMPGHPRLEPEASTASGSGSAFASSTASSRSPGTRRPRRASSPTARSAASTTT